MPEIGPYVLSAAAARQGSRRRGPSQGDESPGGVPSGEGHLGGLIKQWLMELTIDQSRELKGFLHGRTLDLGCACSGSGCPTLCATALQRAATTIDIDMVCRHIYATEIKPCKRKFIKTMFPDLPNLFCDVSSLHEGRSMNMMTTPPRMAPVGEVDIFSAGFPCTDASNLNSCSSSSNNRGCIADGSLRTGAVFRNILKLLQSKRQTKLLLLENVAGLAKRPMRDGAAIGPSNLAAVMYLAEVEAGFHLKVFQLTPTDFGVPQARTRLWFIGVPCDLLQAAGMTRKEADMYLEEIMKSFIRHHVQNLDDWLLPESHPLIQEVYQKLLFEHFAANGQWSDAMMAGGGVVPPATRPRKRQHRGPQGSWPEAHAALAAQRGLDWWAPQTVDSQDLMEQPGILALGPRELDIVRMRHLCPGSAQPQQHVASGCLDVSQSAPRTIRLSAHSGIVPCVTPAGRRFLTHRHRLTHPVEDLHLQGLYYLGREQALQQFSGSLISDIAGNAFEASCCAASMLAGLLLISRCEGRKARRSMAIAPCIEIVACDGVGAADSDSDGDLNGVFLVRRAKPVD